MYGRTVRIWKRIVSMLLVITLLIGAVPVAASATDAEPEANLDTGDVSLEGSNDLGQLLSQEIEEQYERETEYSGAYSVTDLTIAGNTAVVEYGAMEEAIVMVSIYTEDGYQMVTSGKATVSPDSTEATVTISGTMPEYFLAKAFLVDTYDYSPLCAAYETPIYTRAMQELLASTVEDYDPEKVLNLDEDNTTNFMVYSDDTILVEEQTGVNTIASVDEENLVYVIENADDTFLYLQEGDIISYPYGEDDYLFIKVASIEVEDTTVTIQGAELALEDVFSHVKIQGEGDSSQAILDDTTCGEGVTCEISGGSMARSGSRINAGGSVGTNISGTLQGELENKEGKKVTISGGYQLGLTVHADILATEETLYIDFKTDMSYGISISLTAEAEYEVNLAELKIPIVAGLAARFLPKLTIRVTGEISASISTTQTVGIQYTTASGAVPLRGKPVTSFEVEASVTVFFGIDLNPSLVAVSDKILSISTSIPAGIEIAVTSAVGSGDESDELVQHSCDICFAFDVSLLYAVTWEIKAFNIFVLNGTVVEGRFGIGAAYNSVDHSDGGWGKCPYIGYQVTVKAVDDKNNPYADVGFNANGEYIGTTNSNGVFKKVLAPGTYEICGLTTDLQEQTKTVEVKEPTNVRFVFDSVEEDDGETGGGTDVETTEPTEPPFFDPNAFGVVDTSPVTFGYVQGYGYCGPNAIYERYSNGVVVISGTGEIAPEYVTGYWRNEDDYIDQYWLTNISVVRISEGITSIGSEMFRGCSGLQKISVPSTVTYIGNEAFSYCNNLYNLQFDANVTSMGVGVFADCDSLTRISLPEGMTYIGESMFDCCDNLTAVRIPSTVTEIADKAFYYCISLRNIQFNGPLNSIGKDVFAFCDGLTSVKLPDGLTKISRNLFYECYNLVQVNIPDSVIHIDEFAFASCKSLEEISFPRNIVSIDNSAFSGCSSLKSVKFPDSLQLLGEYVFSRCESLTTIDLNKIESMGEGVFSQCCNLESVKWSSKIEEMGDWTFSWCENLKYVDLGTNLKVIGDSAFSSCYSLEEIHLPDGLIRIGEAPFLLTALKSLVIPASVTHLGSGCLSFCDTLHEVWFLGDYPVCEDYVSGNHTKRVFFPEGNPTWVQENIYSGWYYLQSENWYSFTVDEYGNRIVDWDSDLPYRYELEPEETEPEATEPEETEPEVIEPEATEPEATEPEATEPEATEPEATEPEVTEPEVTEPGETEPEVTMPEVTPTPDDDLEDIPDPTKPQAPTEVTMEPEETEPAEEPDFPILTAVLNLFALKASAEETEEVPEETEYPVLTPPEPEMPELPELEEPTDYSSRNPKRLQQIEAPHYNSVVGGEHEIQSGTTYMIHTATFRNLVPGQQYLLLDLASISGTDHLAASNVLNIDQGVADSSGKLVIEYAQREENSSSYVVACGPSNQDLNEALIRFPDMESNGELQVVDPSVDYYGTALTENQDYVLLGQTSFTDPGSYTCYIRGIRNYTGLVRCQYLVQAPGTAEKQPAYETGVSTMEELQEALDTAEDHKSVGIRLWSDLTLADSITIPLNVTLYTANDVTLEVPAGMTVTNHGAFIVYTDDNLTITGTWDGNDPSYVGITDSGTFGDGLTWKLFEDYTLLIEGTGPMPDFTYKESSIPWVKHLYTMEEVVIREGITALGDYAFYNTGVQYISLPASLTSMGNCSLEQNSFLTYIYVDEASETYASNEGVLLNKDLSSLLLYPCGRTDNYYVIPETVKTLEDRSFASCTNLYEVTLPDGLTHIGNSAFDGCYSLQKMNIPADVVQIGNHAFYNCSGLSELTVAAENTHYCSENNVLFDKDKTTLIQAIRRLSGRYELPETVKHINDYAFYSCWNLTEAILPDGLETIGMYAFQSSNLSRITIPASVTTIGMYCFAYSDIEEIYFEGDCPQIRLYAFNYLSMNAYYPSGNATWTSDVLQNYGGTVTWLPYEKADNRIAIDPADLGEQTSVWIDGKEYAVKTENGASYVDLPNDSAQAMVVYTYGESNGKPYPVSMKVWLLENENNTYTATRVSELDDILQYEGCSIRVTGKQGIRMITSVDEADKAKLIAEGLVGYTLKEYGTAVAWADEISEDHPLVLGKSYVSSNYAYNKAENKDPVFAYNDGCIQYTNVLVGFTLDQCADDLAMRSYIILEDANGQQITLYGGIVERSIRYIASEIQNQNIYSPESAEYEYLQTIINGSSGTN